MSVSPGLNHPNIATHFGLEHAAGKHVLVMELVEGEGLGRRILNRLTYSPRSEFSPRWFPDGRRIAFVLHDPPFNIWTVPADGSAQPTSLLQTSADSYADSISSDGQWMAVRESRANSGYDLELLQITEGSKRRGLFLERRQSVRNNDRDCSGVVSRTTDEIILF